MELNNEQLEFIKSKKQEWTGMYDHFGNKVREGDIYRLVDTNGKPLIIEVDKNGEMRKHGEIPSNKYKPTERRDVVEYRISNGYGNAGYGITRCDMIEVISSIYTNPELIRIAKNGTKY